MRDTFDLIEAKASIGSMLDLWRAALGVLASMKRRNFNLVKQIVVGYLQMFGSAFDRLGGRL